jgi:hypothetical protein
VFRFLFHFTFVASLAVWVGTIVFFSAVVTPAVFDALGRPGAGDLLSRLFPRYYLAGAVCGIAALGAALLLFLFDSGSRGIRLVQVLVVVLMLAGNVYAGTILRGRLDSLRQERTGYLDRSEREVVERRFAQLHRRSVILNLSVLGLGAAGLALSSLRRKP